MLERLKKMLKPLCNIKDFDLESELNEFHDESGLWSDNMFLDRLRDRFIQWYCEKTHEESVLLLERVDIKISRRERDILKNMK